MKTAAANTRNCKEFTLDTRISEANGSQSARRKASNSRIFGHDMPALKHIRTIPPANAPRIITRYAK